MEPGGTRRTDRVSVELVVQVLGSDATGREFFEEGQTVAVSRYGANLRLARKLAPQQEITIKCLETGREAAARVVGQVEAGPETFTYGISLIDPGANPWGIEFPPASESAQAAGRAVMECLACRVRELVYLTEYELEVLEANQSLSRNCKRCGDATVWKKTFGEVPPESPPRAPSPPPPALEPQEKRREPRRPLGFSACIRSQAFGDDVVTTRNVSRGGVCFESSKHYAEGSKVEVAVPYSSGGGNIFLSGRIVYAQPSPSSDLTLYGVAYVEYKK